MARTSPKLQLQKEVMEKEELADIFNEILSEYGCNDVPIEAIYAMVDEVESRIGLGDEEEEELEYG